MLILVRHGSTSLNEDGSEKIRSWGNWPLTKQGRLESQKAAVYLKSVKPYALYCSDLLRAVQTAEEIADTTGLELEPREGLRDWNVGIYTGQDLKKVLPKLQALIKEPVEIAPQGEAYNTFLGRYLPTITDFVETDDVCVAVTHGRCLMAGLALAKAKGNKDNLDKEILLSKNKIEPGSLLVIQKSWSYRIHDLSE